MRHAPSRTRTPLRSSGLPRLFALLLLSAAFLTIPLRAALAGASLGNYPNTSVALGGEATVTPDAPPASTTSINVSTDTNFKGKLTADPATGVVRVTNAHPAGAYAVTVRAFDSGGSSVTRSFTLTVQTGTACGVGFNSAADITSVNGPASVAIGDFNNDGKQDLAVVNAGHSASANAGPNNVSIRLGDGAGNFSGSTNVTVASDPRSVLVGDFNNDGNQDLAVTSLAVGKISIRLGDGAGNFSNAPDVSFDADSAIIGLGDRFKSVIADFNSDGKQDLAVANFSSGTVAIRLGDGAGNFSSAPNVAVGSAPDSVAAADFNSDGKQDLAVANIGSDTVSIRLGDGAGNFSGSTNVTVGSSPGSVNVGDFNSDGKQDFAVMLSSAVAVRLGDGAGGFTSAPDVSFSGSLSALTIGDFNNDGKQDLAVAGITSTTVSIRLGDGAGNFSSAPNVAVGNGPESIAIGDFNTDGKQDLAVANISSDTVSIRLGVCPVPTLGNYTGSTNMSVGASATVTPDAAPSNVTSINVSTSTSFKGVLTADPATGAVRVTNAYPAGTYVVTVKGFDSSGASATKTFTLTVTSGASCAGLSSFTNAADVGVGTSPYAVAVGDFNNDGKQDLAVINSNAVSNSVSIRLGNGAGGFTTVTDNLVGSSPVALVVGDFNGDGKQDLAVINNGANTVSIRLGDGTGAFSSAPDISFPSGSGLQTLAAGDFNSDGKQDLAISKSGASAVAIRLGNGAGGFTSAPDAATNLQPYAIVLGDFNSDGKQDFAVTNGAQAVSVRLGDGAGNFTGSTEVGVGSAPDDIAVGDFNSDGKQDLAVANQMSHTVSIRLGDGAGNFNGSTEVSVGSAPSGLALGDFNADGKLDFATANYFANFASIRLGNGAGGFTASADVTVGDQHRAIAVGDFNSDGRQDLVIGKFFSNAVAIRLGACNPSPVINAATGLSRQQGSPAGNSTIATVTDDGGSGTVAVTVNGGASATVNGVTVSNIINSGGVIKADIAADCTASNASFTLQASDGATTATATLNVAVTANAAPTLTYPSPQAVSFNDSLTVTPTGASDNGTVTYQVLAGHGLATAPTVNSGGQVSVTGAQPGGAHTITVRATDNCGQTTDASFTLNVSNASLSVNDVSLTEGDSGTKSFDFTVTLAQQSSLTVKVDYQTASGTATAGSDFQSTSGTLTFNPGDTGKTVTVQVNGDTANEGNETFFVNLSNPVNAAIVDAQGQGTILNDDSPVVQFSAGGYSFAEGAGHGDIIVTRTGALSQPLSVDYQTGDLSGTTPCQTLNTGVASDRCDYGTGVGTLFFASGEAQKTIPLVLVDDAYVEGAEQLSIKLMNPVGAALGSVDTATVTITDNDTQAATTNPIENLDFFIRQLYIDYLGREPEPAGFEFWKARMTGNCPAGQVCDRIDTALRFFNSDEFRERGYFVFLFYNAALGERPSYPNWLMDVSKLNGFKTVQEQEAAKDAFINEFMSRQAFMDIYNGAQTGQAFVDALIQRSGVTPASRQALVDNYATLGRAKTLRAFIETPEVQAAFLDRAFVAMFYFGNLRRSAETDGFNFWMQKLNETNHDYRFLMGGFLQSDEYHFRFAEITAQH